MRDLIALIKQYKEEGRSNAEIRRLTELNYYNAEDFTEITEDGELIIADGITSISQTFAHREYDSHGNLEFYPDNNKTIKRIKVPDSVKDIMHDAFASLHALEEVVLPEDLKYIGENAFANCEKLNLENNCILFFSTHGHIRAATPAGPDIFSTLFPIATSENRTKTELSQPPSGTHNATLSVMSS